MRSQRILNRAFSAGNFCIGPIPGALPQARNEAAPLALRVGSPPHSLAKLSPSLSRPVSPPPRHSDPAFRSGEVSDRRADSQSAKGAPHHSLGQRPRNQIHETASAESAIRSAKRFFIKQKPPPNFSGRGSAYLSAAIICAARWLDRAAGAAAAAISRTRGRVRCADKGDRRYDHQEIFHSILLLNFHSSRPVKGRADALSDRTARRRNLRTIRTDQLANKKPRK